MDTDLMELSQLFRFTAEALDIPPDVDTELREKYAQLAAFLREDHSERYRALAELFPQGSRLLGTMIVPVHAGDGHDLDAVLSRHIARTSVRQSDLKGALGEQLTAYRRYLERHGDEVPELCEGSRCWTLRYDGRFHMDILPALPNDERRPGDSTSILITDKAIREWQVSDPKGYARWFLARARSSLEKAIALRARADGVRVQDIPPDSVKTPLHRLVQLAKRHRDMHHEGERSDKPASILITTLAARSYQDGADLEAAMQRFARTARGLIEVRNGREWVANPMNDEENFADRWLDRPRRREAFFRWLDRLLADVEGMAKGGGLHRVADTLGGAFGTALAERVMRRAGGGLLDLRQRGELRSSSGDARLTAGTADKVVRPHTFYGGRG